MDRTHCLIVLLVFGLVFPVVSQAIEITPPNEGATEIEITDYTFPQAFPGASKMIEPVGGWVTVVHTHRLSPVGSVTVVYCVTLPEAIGLVTLFHAFGDGDSITAIDNWSGGMAIVTSSFKGQSKEETAFTVEGFEPGSTELRIDGLDPGTKLRSLYTTPGRWPAESIFQDGAWNDLDQEENGAIVVNVPRYTAPTYVLPGEIWTLSVDDDEAPPEVVTVEAEGLKTRHVVPVVSHIVGASGVPYISDLTLSNPTGFTISGWIRFIDENGATIEAAPSVDFTLAAGASQSWTDVLQSAFEITANVKGSLVVGGYGHWLLQVSSRNYAVDDEDRRFGIALPGQPTILPVSGQNPWIMPGLLQNDDFRSNLVLAGLAPTTSNVTIRIIADGLVKAETTQAIQPYELVQINRVAEILGAGAIEGGYMEILVEEGGIAAAISVVDGSADDAAYIVARPMFP